MIIEKKVIMIKVKIVVSSLMIGGIVLFGACKKGCTDSTATNFEEKKKKDDGTCTYGPKIKLNGLSEITIPLSSEFLDAGATATNFDGTKADVTVDLGGMNTGQAGTYIVTYTGTNEYGSTSVTRTVTVALQLENWTVNWDLTNDCGNAFPLSSTPTIEAGATSQELNITGMFTLVGGTANATISGATITIPTQTFGITGGDITYDGIGTMNATGTQIIIDYDYVNSVPFVGGTGTCTAIYTKQ